MEQPRLDAVIDTDADALSPHGDVAAGRLFGWAVAGNLHHRFFAKERHS